MGNETDEIIEEHLISFAKISRRIKGMNESNRNCFW